MRWLLQSGDAGPAVHLMLGLVALWNYRGYWAEGSRWLGEGLQQGDVLPGAERAKAYDAAGRLAWQQHDFAAAIAHHTEALRLFQELEDVSGTTRAMFGLAGVHLDQGNYEQARHLYEASLVQFRELGQVEIALEGMSNLGVVAICEGDLDRADALLHEVLQAWRTTGTPGSACWPLAGLGRIALDRGDPQAAKGMLREALELAHAHRYPQPLGGSLNALAKTALVERCPERAARLYGVVECAYEGLGVVPSHREPTRRDQFLAAGRSALGEDAWQRAWAEGRQMTLNQAVEYGLNEDDSSVSSRREMPLGQACSCGKARTYFRGEHQDLTIMPFRAGNRLSEKSCGSRSPRSSFPTNLPENSSPELSISPSPERLLNVIPLVTHGHLMRGGSR